MYKKLSIVVVIAMVVASLVLNTQLVSASTVVAITSPTSGSSVTGTSFTVTGSATAKRAITVKVNGTTVGSTTSDNSGNWSLNVTGQTAGAKTIEATASVSYAYTFSNTASTMSVINTVTDEKIGSDVSTSVIQSQGVVSPDGTQMVTEAGFGNGANLKVWSLANPEVPVVTHNITAADANTVAIRYTPDGTYFYATTEAADFSGGHITRYNSADPTISASVTGYNQNFPADLGFKANSSTMYVANVISGTISVIDVASNTQTSTFVSGGGSGGSLSPDDVHMYSVGGGLGGVVPIDVSGPTSGALVATGTNPRANSYNLSGSQFIVNNFSSDNFSVIDTATDTVTNTISTGTGSGPVGLAFLRDYSKLYIANSGLDQVSVRDPSTFAELKTIAVGDTPYGLTTGPIQSATTSVSFTLASATLAETGVNSHLASYFAFASLASGVGGVYIMRRKNILV